MIDFDDFSRDAQGFVIAVLLSMPWASARNIAGLGHYSVQHLRRVLRQLERDGLVYGMALGRVYGRTTRFIVTSAGKDWLRTHHPNAPKYPYSYGDPLWLLCNIERLEVVYEAVQQFWADFSAEDIGEGVWIRETVNYQPVDLVVGAAETPQLRLVGFAWCRLAYIHALAIFRSRNATEDVILPIFQYALESGRIPGGIAFFQGVNFDPFWDALYAPEEPVEQARPIAALAVVADRFAAYCLSVNGGGIPAVPYNLSGNRLNGIQLFQQEGIYRKPLLPPGAANPEEDPDRLVRELEQGGWLDFRLGVLESKALRLVESWHAVRHRDAVNQLGQTNGTRITKAFESLIGHQLVDEIDGTYFLAARGIELKAYRESVPQDAVRRRLGYLLNLDGTVSRRGLRRAAKVARIGLLLEKSGIETAIGRRADISFADRDPLGLAPHFPDLYIRVTHNGRPRWSPLEFAEGEPDRQASLERLEPHRQRYYMQCTLGFSPPRLSPLFVVAETPAVQTAIVHAANEANLPVGTITLDTLVAQCAGGADPRLDLFLPES